MLTSMGFGLWMLVQGAVLSGPADQDEPEVEECTAGSEDEEECWFGAGLTFAIAGRDEPAGDARTSLLLKAAWAFERVLKLAPERASALNNLAQVYSELGRAEAAERLFERAVSLVAPLRPFYHRNYGDFLSSHGERSRAAEQYRRTLAEAPADRQAHDSLVRVLGTFAPESLPEYLWFLIALGQVDWAEDVALRRLPESGSDAEQFLTILVASWAQHSLPSDEVLSSEAAGALRRLVDRPDVGEGVREVLLLLQSGDREPSHYSWWAERGSAWPGDSGLSPRRAFRHLIRSLGEEQREAGRFDLARDDFRLAVRLSRDEPDLLAFRQLVDLPLTAADLDALDSLVRWNEEVLRRVPATQADLYLYSHDLGLFYVLFERWEGEGPSAGIYQLARAVSFANTAVVKPPGGDPPFDARIYSYLMAGYLATGKPEKAEDTWLDLAKAYRAHGLEAEGDTLLALANRGRLRRPSDRRSNPLDDPPLLQPDVEIGPPKSSPPPKN